MATYGEIRALEEERDPERRAAMIQRFVAALTCEDMSAVARGLSKTETEALLLEIEEEGRGGDWLESYVTEVNDSKAADAYEWFHW